MHSKKTEIELNLASKVFITIISKNQLIDKTVNEKIYVYERAP